LAITKLEEVFARTKVAGLYRNRIIAITLCQGSAQHFIDGRNGVKDDAEHRSDLIHAVYKAWRFRLAKRSHPPGVYLAAPTWEDVEQMFRDIQAVVGVPEKPSRPRRRLRRRSRTLNDGSVIPLDPQRRRSDEEAPPSAGVPVSR
jgi:hypothetical protein